MPYHHLGLNTIKGVRGYLLKMLDIHELKDVGKRDIKKGCPIFYKEKSGEGTFCLGCALYHVIIINSIKTINTYMYAVYQ